MCRIFGTVGEKMVHEAFERLTLLSKKGGPDATCYHTDEFVQFGFNRLSILDTSEKGNQPFVSPSGRYVLMLNGEVYNYNDIKYQYNITQVKSGSDAEVVLYLIEKLGFHNAIPHLNGMFAIACWDSVEKQLFLARDFAGIKPLFYSSTNNGIVFGSQFNQILKHPYCYSWTPSTIGMSEYLQFGYMLPPNTIANNVFQLEVGEMLSYSVKDQTYKKHKYESFFKESGNVEDVSSDASPLVNKAIKNAVERQLVSDVPLGVFLSGGIDSSLVAAHARVLNPDVTALTIGFEDHKYDESSKAIEYAKHLQIKHHHVEMFNQQKLLDVFEEHFEEMPEPIADYSSLPTYLVSKIARKNHTVMLSGDGGDELFWGYPRFLTFANSTNWFKIPGAFNRKIVKGLLKKCGVNITGFLGENNMGKANMYFHSCLSPSVVKKMIGNYQISEETMNSYAYQPKSTRETLDYLRRNEFYCHLQKVLVKVDRMSMANSLEVRVPLLDKEVIHASERIHSTLGVKHQMLKKLLKEELYHFIPQSLVDQQKRGFTPPLATWVSNELKSEVSTILLQYRGRLFNSDIIPQFLENYYENNTLSLEGFWTLYVLLKWLKTHQH
jgi:asparagine synthase (glutamine-hydrolysing)